MLKRLKDWTLTNEVAANIISVLMYMMTAFIAIGMGWFVGWVSNMG